MGELTRKGESRPATPEDMQRFERAQSLQALQVVPVLQRAGNPHEYLFFALFDGTGQDADNPRQELTNVGVLSKQAGCWHAAVGRRIGYEFVEHIAVGAARHSFDAHVVSCIDVCLGSAQALHA